MKYPKTVSRDTPPTEGWWKSQRGSNRALPKSAKRLPDNTKLAPIRKPSIKFEDRVYNWLTQKEK